MKEKICSLWFFDNFKDHKYQKMISSLCAGCTSVFIAEQSAPDRITLFEKKLDSVDSLIRELKMLRNDSFVEEIFFKKLQKLKPSQIEWTAHPVTTVRR